MVWQTWDFDTTGMYRLSHCELETALSALLSQHCWLSKTRWFVRSLVTKTDFESDSRLYVSRIKRDDMALVLIYFTPATSSWCGTRYIFMSNRCSHLSPSAMHESPIPNYQSSYLEHGYIHQLCLWTRHASSLLLIPISTFFHQIMIERVIPPVEQPEVGPGSGHCIDSKSRSDHMCIYIIWNVDW